MKPEQQAEALTVIQAITHNTPRLPGNYRQLVDEYVEHQRNGLKYSMPPTIITFISGIRFWEVMQDEKYIATIPKKLSGLDVVFKLLSEPSQSSYSVFYFLEDQSHKHPARTLQKRLKRARDTLGRYGAGILADHLADAVTVSDQTNLLSYVPKKRLIIQTKTVFKRS